jgi:hypothetical protein
MKSKFELVFRDSRKLNTFIKTCEALCSHSDTALFKVKKRGIYILLTDFESSCIVETRITNVNELNLVINVKEFTAKILLDSLVNELRKCFRNKKNVILFGEENNILKIKEIKNNNTVGNETLIKSTEHRLRVFHIISTREFINKSKDYIKFRIINTEFNKIITTQAILSGINGGVGKLIIEPKEDDEVDIIFSLRNNGGSYGTITITTFTKSEDVPILHMPKKRIEITYLLTYLKRSQTMLSFPTDYVTIYVSERGLILHTDIKDNISTLMYTNDVSNVDLDSFS